MTAEKLKNFIDKYEGEYHWYKDDVVLFIDTGDLVDFQKLFENSSFLDEGGYPCTMKDCYFCFYMKDICNYYNIDMNEIFTDKD